MERGIVVGPWGQPFDSLRAFSPFGREAAVTNSVSFRADTAVKMGGEMLYNQNQLPSDLLKHMCVGPIQLNSSGSQRFLLSLSCNESLLI